MEKYIDPGQGEVIETEATTSEFAAVGPITAELFLGDSPEAAQRRSLCDELDMVFVSTEVGQGIGENDALHRQLTEFLAADPNNARLLLYLPFELLPDLSEGVTSTPAQIEFGQEYKDAWIRILHETEPRANFVDGDILEPGLEDPERVSKAGHLAPELLVRNILSAREALLLLEIINDETILTSLAEGLIVANAAGLINSSDWTRMEAIISSKIGEVRRPSKNSFDYNNPNSDNISRGRAQWLRKVEQEEMDNKEAQLLAEEIIEGVSLDQILQKGKTKAVLLGIIMAGIGYANTDLEKAQKFSQSVEPVIKMLQDTMGDEAQDIVIGGLNKWVRKGIVDSEFIERFGVRVVDLSLPSQFDENEFKQEFGHLIAAAQKISQHPELSKALYPIFLLYGSRTKGHANFNSDLDLAVFFKQEAKHENRDEIIAILREEAPGILHYDAFIEFWTQIEDGKMYFIDPKETKKKFMGEEQIHFLMSGVWIGEKNSVEKIRDEIVDGNFEVTGFGEEQEEKRRMFLGLLELDAVQYRVLHKGYKKLYPSARKDGNAKSELIDWDSDFWDPGYRRVATKLFLSKVFLPDLS